MTNASGTSPLNPSQLILYACPTGELADQLDGYFTLSRTRYGENAAHHYMPHCTLTGFFHDVPSTISFYTEQLDVLLSAMRSTEPQPVISMTGISFNPNFHGIELESPWLRELVERFIQRSATPSRTEPIRKKDWLHLSLAYEFPAEQQTPLKTLAEAMIHLDAAVSWQLRFYERHPDQSWTCHKEWAL